MMVSHHIVQNVITSSPGGKNCSCHEISEISDSCDFSTWRKKLHKCEKTSGKMAAKQPSLAVTSKYDPMLTLQSIQLVRNKLYAVCLPLVYLLMNR